MSEMVKLQNSTDFDIGCHNANTESPRDCTVPVRSKERKKERNLLQEGMWRTSDPQRVYIPIGGRGTKGLYPGSAFVTSRYLHLYVMVVLSGARVVRAL